MPLVRIDLDESVSPDDRSAISRGVHAAVVASLAEVPDDDDFQIMTVHAPGQLSFHPTYSGPDPAVQRDRIIFIQILIDQDKSRDIKRGLFTNIARELTAAGIKRDEIFVALSFNGPNDWWAGSDLNVPHLTTMDTPRATT
jgi:hypothetical protein